VPCLTTPMSIGPKLRSKQSRDGAKPRASRPRPFMSFRIYGVCKCDTAKRARARFGAELDGLRDHALGDIGARRSYLKPDEWPINWEEGAGQLDRC
jgi:hypothetical protein